MNYETLNLNVHTKNPFVVTSLKVTVTLITFACTSFHKKIKIETSQTLASFDLVALG
jgi:hypothetical protein